MITGTGNAKLEGALKLRPKHRTVNLWMDSSDFPVQKTANTKNWWSHKLTGVGIRVQFIADATERVRFIHGPLDPGQFDGDFVLFHRELIREKFPGGKIIADNHYSKANDIFGGQANDPTFYCNLMENATDKKVAEKENLPTHSKGKKRKREIDVGALSQSSKQYSMKKLKRNAVISHTRGRIEGIFGNLKRKFNVISTRYFHDPIRLYETVVIANAVNNLILERNL